jgi:hypothetical protein
MPSLRTALLLLTIFALSSAALAQTRSDKPSEKFALNIISGTDSSVVTKALVNKLNASKPFVVVSKDDVSKANVIVDCMHRDKPEMPFICMFVSHSNGAAFKRF